MHVPTGIRAKTKNTLIPAPKQQPNTQRNESRQKLDLGMHFAGNPAAGSCLCSANESGEGQMQHGGLR